MKQFCSLLLIGALLLPALPVQASDILTITAAEARGDHGTIPTVPIAINQGLHIKFIDQKVYKGWLDNDIAEVDSDRPFEQGAGVIMLVPRRLGTAKLSVIARDTAGQEHLYVLRLETGGISPDIISIAPPLGLGPSSFSATQLSAQILRSGIKEAMRQQILVEGSPLWQAATQFVTLIDTGLTAQEASTKTGLSLQVVHRLLQLGDTFPSNDPPLPAPLEDKQVLTLNEPLVEEDQSEPLQEEQQIAVISPPTVDQEQLEAIQAAHEAELRKIEEGYQAELQQLRAQIDREQERERQRLNKQYRKAIKRYSKAQKQELKNRRKWLRQQIKKEDLVLSALPETARISLTGEIIIPPPVVAQLPAKKPEVSPQDISVGLVRGLATQAGKKLVWTYREYYRFQDAIILSRRGVAIEDACRRAGISLSRALQILSFAGIELQLGG